MLSPFTIMMLQFIMMIEILSEVSSLAGYEEMMIIKNFCHTQCVVVIPVGLFYEMLSLCFVLIVVLGMYPHLTM